MNKIDGSRINQYVEGSKKKKPPFISVDQQEWENALEGYQESLSEAVDENTDTEQFWHMIYFSALAFCKGMEYAEIKLGKRQESNYPRY